MSELGKVNTVRFQKIVLLPYAQIGLNIGLIPGPC